MSVEQLHPLSMARVFFPKWITVTLLILVMLVFGASCTLLVKLEFEMRAVGNRFEDGAHLFDKPWFTVFQMFLGESIALVAYVLKRTCMPEHEKCVLTWWGIIWRSSIAALLDLIGTGFMSMGLLRIVASEAQMLRGWAIFFTALLSKRLMRKMFEYRELVGLGMAVVALIIVGLAGVLGGDSKSVGLTSKLWGVLLCSAGQLLQSAQTVWEEKVMKEVYIAPLLLIGIEGIIGLALMCMVVLPLLSQVPGYDVGGVQENVWDTLAMLHHSPRLIALSLAYTFSLFMNMSLQMYVTKMLSAVHVLLVQSGLRTMAIWAVGLGLFYSTDGVYGEQWVWGRSLLELAGFALFLVGSLVYSKLIDLPCKCGKPEPQAEGDPRDLEMEEGFENPKTSKMDGDASSAASQQSALEGKQPCKATLTP